MKYFGVKLAVFLFLLIGSWFYFSSPTRAHFIENEGPVLIMLHTSDDDNPIIGQPADLTFYITDSQKKFKAAECNCQLTITLNNNVIFSTTTYSDIKNNPIFSYIFPQKGIYSIHFSAKPVIEESFQSFDFDYDMRIDRTMEQVVAARASAYRIYLVLGIMIILSILFIKFKKHE